jgi:glycosyltransferase involved in cell wall biosynthesis
LKILHISTYDSGGAGLSCIRLHKGLLELGCSSKVLVLNKTTEVPEVYRYESTGAQLPKIIRWPWLFIKLVLLKLRIPLSRLQKLQFELNCLRQKSSPVYTLPLSEYNVASHPLVKEADIIHLHWVAGFLDWPSFFANIDKPVVWTIHDENLYYGGFHYHNDRNSCLEAYQGLEDKLIEIKQNSLSHCRNLAIVSLSKMMLELSLSGEIVKDRKHFVIHNAVDKDSFIRYDKKYSRSVFNLPEDRKIILFISYYLNDKNKGFRELVTALNELDISGLVLFAVGLGKLEIDSKTEINYAGVINDPRLLAIAYSASDLYVLPSSQEAFAQTPLEAMACGLPVVAFPVSGTEELINKKNGIRTSDFKIDSLKEGIMQAMGTQYDGALIREDVINRFGVKNIVSQYLDVYSDSMKQQADQL